MREDEGGERETVEFSLSMSMERVRVCVRVHTGPVNTLLHTVLSPGGSRCPDSSAGPGHTPLFLNRR